MKQFFTPILLFVLFLSNLSDSYGQVQIQPIYPIVYHQDQHLDLAFAGGINSAQYQEIDLDQDGDLDLIIFDRSSDKINGFENNGSSYLYQPKFEYLFPKGMQNWLVLKDYDCDGHPDIFTSSSSGIEVYHNLTQSSTITWELVAKPLLSEGETGPINIFLNSTDIPSIEDLDGDGDLDILVFDFASGDNIEFHKNRSVENGEGCGLSYHKESEAYGNIHICDCADVAFDDSCDITNERVLHIGAKALLSLDMNQDGLLDLVYSEEDCNDLSYMQNEGTAQEAVFTEFTSTFPDQTNNLDFTTFPAAYHLDVTFDGIPDILISSNNRDNSLGNIDFKQSSFVYPNDGQNDFKSSSLFLQDDMIDVGAWAYPSIVDTNGDGLRDIVLGNEGSIINNEFVSTLTLYQAHADGSYHLEDVDLWSFSQLDYTSIRPQFVDFNQDGLLDLAYTALNDKKSQKSYYILGTSDTELVFDPSQSVEISLIYNYRDHVYYFDMDEDEDLDALVGRSYGELDYYENTGAFTFVLKEQNILGTPNETGATNINMTIGDTNQDGLDDLLITERSGRTKIYLDFPANTTDFISDVVDLTDSVGATRFGRASFPTMGTLTQTSLIVGSIQGGIRLYEFSNSSNDGLQLIVFPNPSPDGMLTFRTNKDALLKIFTTSGYQVSNSISLDRNMNTLVNLQGLKPGMYIATATVGKQRASKKILILH
ncbi:MAG: T9SS type A sorting domain-containing protein [Reichenbachiella sp.]